LVPTRIPSTRHRPAGGRRRHPARRRSWLALAGLARTRATERLGISSFARISLAAAALLLLAFICLLVNAQETQSSYELNQLRQENAQLQAEQDQLRYQKARLETPALVDQAAASRGMTQTDPSTYVSGSPTQVDLSAPIGPPPPSNEPRWRRLLDLLLGGSSDRRGA
jgi:cell division protein FtsL